MDLRSDDVAAFETVARERAAALAENEVDAAAILAALEEISSSSLPRSEVARRAGRLAQMLPSTPSFQQALATAAASAEAAVRSAIVTLLPPHLQQAAYASDSGGGQPAADGAPISDVTPAVQLDDEPTTASGAAEDVSGEWRTVLLLGSAQDTAENARLLQSKRFATVRVSDANNLSALAGERICGLIIHKSWWQQIPDTEARVSFVHNQILRSNLLRMHIDCRGLDEAEPPVSEAIANLDTEVRDRVSTAQSSLPTELDLLGFAAAADLLSKAETALVGIEGIDGADRRLIAGAVESFAAREHLAQTGEEEHLTVRPIFEGQSGARVLSVRSAAFRTMLVAKLAPLDDLREELDRARRAMPPPLQIGTEPCLYSLNGKGVLLQRLYTEFDRPEAGAPSLRERLAQCTAWENGRPGLLEPSLPDLEQGINRAVAGIKEVNREAGDEPESTCWLNAEPLERFAELDMHWSVESSEDVFDPAELVPRVRETIATQGRTHVIHGDLHTGNLLMQDQRTPCLIDFAAAGTGHPCFDLVRISSGIAYEFIRPLTGEAALRRFFTRVHVDGASKDELFAEFPDLLRGIGAKLAVHTLTTCRQASIEALAGVNATTARDQYLAMTYLIAAQSLTIPSFQMAVVRGALGAIAPTIVPSAE